MTWVPLPGMSDSVCSWWKLSFSSGICEQSPPSKLRIVARRRNGVYLAASGSALTVCVMYPEGFLLGKPKHVLLLH